MNPALYVPVELAAYFHESDDPAEVLWDGVHVDLECLYLHNEDRGMSWDVDWFDEGLGAFSYEHDQRWGR